MHDEYKFERRGYGSHPEQLRLLAEWLIEQQVEEAVMESTTQYWKPVWEALERYWKPVCQKRKVPARRLEHCIWRKPCPIAGGVRFTSSTRTDWRVLLGRLKRAVHRPDATVAQGMSRFKSRGNNVTSRRF
jgi:hypothetical protein